MRLTSESFVRSAPADFYDRLIRIDGVHKGRFVTAGVVAASIAACGGDASQDVRNQASAPSPNWAVQGVDAERLARGLA
jgi:hypothetical protein